MDNKKGIIENVNNPLSRSNPGLFHFKGQGDLSSVKAVSLEVAL